MAPAEESGRCRDFAPERRSLGAAPKALRIAMLVLVALPAMAEEPAGTPTSREALAICHRAQDAPEGEASDLLKQSRALADRAIEADGNDALAYFARFCALGEQARRSGASLSSLVKLWAIRDAIDRTLEIAPDFADALYGKGALLNSLPRIVGGDPREAERLVRRALQIDPDYVGARLFLARSLLERGDRDAAREQARAALAVAERKNDAADVTKASQLLQEIGD